MRVPSEYSLLHSVHAWIFPDVQPVPEITWEDGFGRVIQIDGINVPIIINQRNTGKPLHIVWENDSVSKQGIVNKVKHTFGLDLNMSGALMRFQQDIVLSKFYQAVRSIRPYSADSPYEALVKTIIQQQISYRAANVITKRLIEECDRRSNLSRRVLFAFPEPTDIINRGEEVLRTLGLGYKVPYILNITKMVLSGELDLMALYEQDPLEIRRILQPIRGIGEWTIQAVLIAGLKNFSEFPYGDLGIRNIIGNLYNNGIRVSAQQVKELAEEWGPDGGLVLYLLMCADVLGFLGEVGRPKMHKR